MNALWLSLVGWLVDFQLLAAGLLVAALTATWLLRQPAARLAALRPTLAGLVVLALLAAAPGWSLVHLRSEPPSAAVPLPVPEQATRATQPQSFPGVQPAYEPPLAKIAPLSPLETPQATTASPAPAVDESELPWFATPLAIAYLTGALAVAFWLAAGGWQTRGIVRRARPAAGELTAVLAALTAPGPAPRLCVSDEIAAAAAVGWRRPTILLPGAKPQAGGDAGVGDATADFTAILAHEWAHVRHGDLRTIALCRWLLVLLWPQPLYWLVRRIVRLDQETLADAAAAELTTRADYAERLVAWARRSATGPRPPRLAAAAGLWESPSQLKRRVMTLLDEKFTVLRECSRRWRVACRIAAACGAFALSLVTLQPGAALEITAKNSKQVSHAKASAPVAMPKQLNLRYDSGESSQNDFAITLSGEIEHGSPETFYDREAGDEIYAYRKPDLRVRANLVDASAKSAESQSSEPAGAAEAPTWHAPPATAGEPPADEPTKTMQAAARAFYRESPPKPNVIAGLCYDEAGRPLAGVEVSLYLYKAGFGGANQEPAQRIGMATTENDGQYRFKDVIDVAKVYPRGVPAENMLEPPVWLVATLYRSAGRATRWDNREATWMLKNGMTRFVIMHPAATLRGRIVDKAGRPVAGAAVSTNRYGRIPGASFTTATTDAQGRFEIRDVGFYDRETALKEHKAVLASRLAAASDAEREILKAQTAGGAFEFFEMEVNVSHPRYVAATAAVAKIPGEIEATLSPGATLTGRVVKASAEGDEPAAGCVISVEPLPEPKPEPAGVNEFVAFATWTKLQMSVTTTDAAGTYRVDSLPAGEYRVAVAAGNEWVARGIDSVKVNTGETTAAPEVKLTKGALVRAQLVEAETGEPLTLEKPRKGWLHGTPRDGRPRPLDNGIVEFSAAGVGQRRLAPGNYALWATLPNDGPTHWPQLTSIPANLPVDKWPTYDLIEGQTLDLKLPMRREEEPRIADGVFVPGDLKPVAPISEKADAKTGNELEADAADGASTARDLERAQRLVADAKYSEALAAYERLLTTESELHRAIALNNLAHLLATCPDVTVRNGGRAVKLAEDALALAPAEARAEILDTLGAAQWEAGDADQALATLREAVDAANDQPGVQAKLEAKRQRYEAALRKQKEQPERAASTASP